MCFTLFFINSYLPAPMIETIIQWRVQEFVGGGGGGENLKVFFFAFQFIKGGPAQKIAEKMIFPIKKVSKYR